MIAPMTVLIGGEKGGSGKTTLATNLAAWLARAGEDVLLVDADRQLTATKWTALRAQQEPALPVVACMQVYGDRVGTIVTSLRKRHRHIIVDTRGGDSEELRSAMVVADKFYSPVRASAFDQWTRGHISSVASMARTFNPRLEARMVIAMAPTNPRIDEVDEARADILAEIEQGHAQRVREGTGDPADYTSYQLLLSDHAMHERKVYRDAAGTGRGVVETDHPKAAHEIDCIAREIYVVEVPVAHAI